MKACCFGLTGLSLRMHQMRSKHHQPEISCLCCRRVFHGPLAFRQHRMWLGRQIPRPLCEECGRVLPNRHPHVCGDECVAVGCTRERLGRNRFCSKHSRQLYRNRRRGWDDPYTLSEAADIGLPRYYASLQEVS